MLKACSAFCRCEQCDYKRETRKGTCFTIVGIFIVYPFLVIVFSVLGNISICKDALDSPQMCEAFGFYLWWLVWLVWFPSFFVFAMFLRMAIRRKYGIREECCTCTGVDGLEDACCARLCGNQISGAPRHRRDAVDNVIPHRRLLVRLLRDRSNGAPRVPRGRDGHRSVRLLLGDGGVIRQAQA